MRAPIERIDYRIIYRIVAPGTRVLDLGCGSGRLLEMLAEGKKAIVQGIELDGQAIHACVEKGLSVFHSDIDSGLQEYPDKCFDYVILNQSMQQVKRIEFVIEEALRVGHKVIIGFPNFANIGSRLVLFFRGKAPMTTSLPYHWYDTPNLRFLSISDFREYCRVNKIQILEQYCLGKTRQILWFRNLLAVNAVFMITRESNNAPAS